MAAIRDYKPTSSLEEVNKGLRELRAKNSAKALAAVDEQTKTQIRKTQAQTAAGVEADIEGALDPAMVAIVAENDKALAENQRKRRANVEKANAYSDQLNKRAVDLDERHQGMKDRVGTLSSRGQAAFDAGAIRGEHRANTLRTVSDQERAYQQFKRQADSYVEFRKKQRTEYENSNLHKVITAVGDGVDYAVGATKSSF
ncbi:hypothetical protein D5018_20090 [Parashewanella curva]|uniref:Uncharacterized protein n=1 Tax=Parashewanella curva TaxID=2338552 RepID=A0A3L8PRQ6_9GAMM|nr:hypothetical protein [Parashewanella curva]RLV57904.1 hypothetical protein D5018_20090 [Parashewanella curva]